MLTKIKVKVRPKNIRKSQKQINLILKKQNKERKNMQLNRKVIIYKNFYNNKKCLPKATKNKMNKAQTTNEAALVEIEAVHHTKDDGCLRTIIMIERITKKDEIQIKINNMEIL